MCVCNFLDIDEDDEDMQETFKYMVNEAYINFPEIYWLVLCQRLGDEFLFFDFHPYHPQNIAHILIRPDKVKTIRELQNLPLIKPSDKDYKDYLLHTFLNYDYDSEEIQNILHWQEDLPQDLDLDEEVVFNFWD